MQWHRASGSWAFNTLSPKGWLMEGKKYTWTRKSCRNRCLEKRSSLLWDLEERSQGNKYHLFSLLSLFHLSCFLAFLWVGGGEIKKYSPSILVLKSPICPIILETRKYWSSLMLSIWVSFSQQRAETGRENWMCPLQDLIYWKYLSCVATDCYWVLPSIFPPFFLPNLSSSVELPDSSQIIYDCSIICGSKALEGIWIYDYMQLLPME